MTASTVPDARPLDPTDAGDLQACRALMRGGSKTFFAASLLLPQRVRAPASALYAFCRLADDAVDLGGDPAAAMQGLTERLDAIYAGRPQAIDADRALAHAVARHAIPRALLDALLDGFLWDAQGRRYETLEDLHGYGARVAGTVGAMMALVMGARDAAALARACELGVAMQLTNIARDVGEDARNGRLYLPRAWLREAGIDPDAWLRAPVFNAALAGVIQRLLDAADLLYRRAEAGVAALPRDCRAAIQAARLVYAEIGRELERRGLDAVNHRAVVPGRRKLRLIARASLAVVQAPARDPDAPPAIAAVQYLVDAAMAEVAGRTPALLRPVPVPVPLLVAAPASVPMAADRSFDQRLAWFFDLLERQAVEQRVLR